MAQSLVSQSAKLNWGGTTATVSADVTVPEGGSIEVVAFGWGSTVYPDFTVSDGTNTLTVAARGHNNSGAGQGAAISSEIHYRDNYAAGDYTVSVTHSATSGNRYGYCRVNVWSGRRKSGSLIAATVATNTEDYQQITAPSITAAAAADADGVAVACLMANVQSSDAGVDAATGTPASWTNLLLDQDNFTEAAGSADYAAVSEGDTPICGWGTLSAAARTARVIAVFADEPPAAAVEAWFNPRRNRPGRGPYSRGHYFRPRIEHRGSPVLSYTLVVADATHGHSVDNVSLAQANTLTVADATHGHAVDAVALIQAHVLTLQDALHAHAVDSVSLTQAGTLAVSDATHAHSVDALDLVQANVLAIQDALHAHAADSVALTQGNTLAVADAAHAHAVDSVALVQAHVLAVADALHAHAAEAPTLSSGETLAVADALHAHAVDAVSLTQAHVLVVQETSHGHSVDAVSLTQANVLAVADALHAHAAEAVTLSSGALLVVADATHGHTVDSPSLTQASALIVSDTLHAQLADAISLQIPGVGGAPAARTILVQTGGRVIAVTTSNRNIRVATRERTITVH